MAEPDRTPPLPPAAITDDEVRRIARLARLTLAEPEVARLAHDLAQILGHVSHLSELALEDGDPAPHAPPTGTRDDVPHPALGTAEATAAAPAVERGHFVVPQVVGE